MTGTGVRWNFAFNAYYFYCSEIYCSDESRIFKKISLYPYIFTSDYLYCPIVAGEISGPDFPVICGSGVLGAPLK